MWLMIFPLSHVDHVANDLSAESCRSCDHVANDHSDHVSLSHVDHVANDLSAESCRSCG